MQRSLRFWRGVGCVEQLEFPTMRFWLMIRRYLWRKIRLPLPGLPGWSRLVREVASVPVWRGDGNCIGAPLAWSLNQREESGRVVPVEATCAWTGKTINGATPIVDEQFDLTNWGVRCARCGVPLHVLEAGMTGSFDVPSCPPCRVMVKTFVAVGV